MVLLLAKTVSLLVVSTNPKNFSSIFDNCQEDLNLKEDHDTQGLMRALVVLIRNTTWRCGKLERSIVSNLYRRNANFGGSGMPVEEMLQRFKIPGKKRNEFLDAIKRLERRNIVEIRLM